MKKLLLFSVLASLVAFTFCSCGKDDDEIEKEEKEEKSVEEKTRYAIADVVVNDSMLVCADVSIVICEGGDSTVYSIDSTKFEKYTVGKDELSVSVDNAVTFMEGNNRPTPTNIENRLVHYRMAHQAKAAGSVTVKYVYTTKNDINVESETVDLFIGSYTTYAIDDVSKLKTNLNNNEAEFHKGVDVDKLKQFFAWKSKQHKVTLTIP